MTSAAGVIAGELKSLLGRCPKIGKFDYLSAPGHSAHSMPSEFFMEDFLAGASSAMRTSADASVHAHGPSLITTHASATDLVLSMEKVSVRSTLA